MLFSAGLATGLVFWGVGEPITHFISPPELESRSAMAAKEAMNITFFHFGIHLWGMYCITAMIIAYFSYKYGQVLSFRTVLYPVFGDKFMQGIMGDIVDSLAVIGTLFGIATSLGFGAMQINSGLNYMFDIEKNNQVLITIIFVLTIISTFSAATGVKKGIKILSGMNLYLVIILMIFFMTFGSTTFIINIFIETIGSYPKTLLERSFFIDAFQNVEWIKDWTVFYWAWIISWTPFIGVFIARISYGRNIKEFILGVLFVPILLSFMWIAIFGGTALDLELNQGVTSISMAVEQDISTAIFNILEYLPLSSIIAVVFLTLIAIYFITSCDSAILVINALISHQYTHPPMVGRIIWGLSIGAIAAILISFGGVKALQTLTIIIALPFLVMLLLGTIGFYRFIKKEEKL